MIAVAGEALIDARVDGALKRALIAYAVAVSATQCTRAPAWGPTAADVDRVLGEQDGLARVR